MVNSIGALDALTAYGRAGGVGTSAPRPAPPPDAHPAGDASFGDMIGGMVSSTATALKAAERASVAQVTGRGDLIDVVTAIGAAETALDTMTAVRDRVVNAYNEIMRMQI